MKRKHTPELKCISGSGTGVVGRSALTRPHPEHPHRAARDTEAAQTAAPSGGRLRLAPELGVVSR